MKRLALFVAVLFALALPSGSALADVHAVSEANCAPTGVPSGASSDGSRAAPGRPDGPIPVNATENADPQGKANNRAEGMNC
jgi:hypothetical protein